MASFRIGMNRLSRLADILDVADKEHRAKGERKYLQSQFFHPCGTPACALGHWAANSTSRWKRRGSSGWPIYRSNTGLHPSKGAVLEFGITDSEAYHLFSSDGCDGARTGKQAAKYIRAFVKMKIAGRKIELSAAA